MEILSFDEKRVCAKCGGTDIGTQYHEKGKYSYPCFSNQIGEHLCRFCRRCHYAWCEKCAEEKVDASQT